MAIYIFGQPEKYTQAGLDFTWTYKQRILEEISQPVRYVFEKIIEQKDIRIYENMKIDVNQLLSVHQYFTNNQTLTPSIRVKDKLEELKKRLQYTSVDYRNSEIRLIRDGFVIATILLNEKDKAYVWGVCYFSLTRLLRMEVYAEGVVYVNYYVTASSESGPYAKLVKRTFYNRDGSVGYDQIFEGERVWYLFPDGRRYTKARFIMEFIKKLNLSCQDVVLLDSSVSKEFINSIFIFGKAARIVALPHVGREFFKDEAACALFSKEYYYNWFSYVEMLDAMVVPTDEQKEQLVHELEIYDCKIPEIKVISTEGEFTFVVLHESYNGNLALSWCFEGKRDGFWIYDESGIQIYETQNMHQHYFSIKGYEAGSGFVVKAYVDTAKGKVSIAESECIHLCAREYDKPVVSLVIPAYNAENFIARTLDNALAQSFCDLEIIAVDDGCTDSTSEIIDWYNKKYRNVVAIHKENGGVAAARNTGVEAARGEYIGFMDNDDMIYPKMIERMYESAKKNNCDIAITSIFWVLDSGYIPSVQYAMKEDEAIPISEFFLSHYIRKNGSGLGVVVWNKLYRASLAKKYKIPVIPYDDVAWTPLILLYAQNVCYLNGHFYEWDRTIRDSTLVSVWDAYEKKEMFEFRKRAVLFYLENGNVQERQVLKELTKSDLLYWEKVYGYEEYGKLWDWIEERY